MTFVTRSGAWLLALCLSVALALAAGEWVSRAFILNELIPTDEASFTKSMAKHHNPELGELSGRPVILGVGDSYGCAGGFEKNFLSIFQRRIREQGYPQALVNVSAPGFQPVDELEMMQRYAPRFHPNTVIQAFFVGNDTDQPPPGRPVWNEGGISFHKLPFSLFKQETWALSALIKRTITYWRERLQVADELRLPLAELLRTDSNGKLVHPFSMSERHYRSVLFNQLKHFRKDFALSKDWLKTRQVLSEMVRLGKSGGAQYVLIALPDQLQVEDAYQDELFRNLQLRREDYDFTIPQRLLRSFAKEQGIAFIDLYPEFKRKGRNGGLYLFQNTHWNDAGNRLAGNLTADAFLRAGLLGRSRPLARSQLKSGEIHASDVARDGDQLKSGVALQR